MTEHEYKVPAFEPTGLGEDEKYDTERRGSTNVGGRKMSRIGPPPGMLTAQTSEGVDEYSKLVALEADNAIKYRTCSWQKVI